MHYIAVKTVHIACAGTSYALFLIRGIWMIRDSSLLQRRWIRIVPHVVDTCLLISALALAIGIHQYPLVNDWLTAKVVGLLIYIGLGTVALKRGKKRWTRIAAWLAAQVVFFYIVAVAITHSPLPWS